LCTSSTNLYAAYGIGSNDLKECGLAIWDAQLSNNKLQRAASSSSMMVSWVVVLYSNVASYDNEIKCKTQPSSS
jgi:hypothetical protein